MVNTHEKIIGVRIGPANAEKLHKVMKLAMNVATNGDRAFLCEKSTEMLCYS